jgi:hypothetical protein
LLQVGGGKRKYHWGNHDPDPSKTNYNASIIGSTTPVGSYPSGMTPERLFDLAGNIWEWCVDKSEEKKAIKLFMVVHSVVIGPIYHVLNISGTNHKFIEMILDFVRCLRLVMIAFENLVICPFE